MADQLGVATLTITVDTKAALQQLQQFKAQAESALGSTGTKAFSGLGAGAQQAGQQAGQKLASGLKAGLKGLKFNDIGEALDFSGALNGTLGDLKQYKRALEELRDVTQTTAPGFEDLKNRISAVSGAIRAAEQTTAQARAEFEAFEKGLNAQAAQRFADSIKGISPELRKSIASGEGFLSTLTKIRDAALSAAAATAKVALKGAGEGVKLAAFGAPKGVTSTINQAIEQVQRLQQQSETASGKVARLTEGLAVMGAGGVAAKGIVDSIGGIGNVANSVGSQVNNLADIVSKLPLGFGELGEVIRNGAATLSNWGSSLSSTAGTLDALTGPMQGVTQALSAMGPEAMAVGGALAFTFAGFQDLIKRSFEPGIKGAREALKGMTADTQALLEALARAGDATKGLASINDLRIGERDARDRVNAAQPGSEERLQATEELVAIQRRLADALQDQLALENQLKLTATERAQIARQLQDAAKPGSQLALPAYQERGLRQLKPGQGGTALDVGLQDAREFTQALVAAGNEAQQLPPIFGQVRQSLEALNAAVGRQTQRGQLTFGPQLPPKDSLQRDYLQAGFKKKYESGFAAFSRRATQLQQNLIAEDQQMLAAKKESRQAQEQIAKELLAQAKKESAQNRANIKDRQGRFRGALGSALIGGGFPLLFGQGLGASVGGGLLGAAGGAVGGQFGFAASIIGTALGQAVDDAVARLQLLGSALDDPIGQFQALAEAGLISAKALQKNVEALIATGREAEAAAQLQLDAAQQFGDTEELKQLASASDEMNRSFARLSVILTKFIAGPLADFIEKIAAVNTAIADRAVFNERLQGLGINEAGRNALVAEARNNTAGERTGKSNAEGAVLLYAEANRLLDERYGKTEEVLQAERRLSEAQERTNKLNALGLDAIDAEVSGNRRLTLELQKQRLELEKANELAALPENAAQAKVEEIEKRYREESYKLTKELAQLDQKRWADSIASANRIKDIQDQTFIASQRQNLSGTGAGVLSALAGLEAAKRAEQNAQAQARVNPYDDNLKSAALEAAEATKQAAAQTKADLLSAYEAAKNSVRTISRSLEDARTALLAAQGGEGGINKYLSPEAAERRQVDANARLFKEASAIARQLGEVATFSGSLTERNAAMADFINNGRQELRAPEDIANIERDLLRANNDLMLATTALHQTNTDLANALPGVIDALNLLTSKDWNVNVAVPGGSASGDIVGAVNSRL